MENSSFSKEMVVSEKELEEEEEEFVLLDLDSIAGHIPIPENAPYILSGLDTLNPILVIDGKIKLVGEYEETIGTCLVLNEIVCEQEAGPSAAKQINPMAQVNKVLKFRLYMEAESDDGENK